MRIAIDARLAGGTNTGDSTYWTNLIKHLPLADPSIELVLITNDSHPLKVPHKVVSLSAKSSLWWSLVKFPLAARKLGANLTHTQYSLSPLCKNGVTTIHDVSFFVGPEWFSERDLRNMQSRIPASVRTAKAVITVSKTSQSEIEHFLPAAKGKTFVAYNACSEDVQFASIEKQETARKDLGIPDQLILSVGTQWARKNMDLAIEAVKRLGETYPHKLVLTGKISEKLTHPRVIQTGYVDQETLNALYSAADIYLAPSKHEGFGIPILEAFRCGTAVICGPGGAMPEVAGNAAVVAQDYEPETWRNLIVDLLNNPSKLQQQVELGKKREREFSWLQSARDHVQAYNFAAK